jgi:hypothetical protein
MDLRISDLQTGYSAHPEMPHATFPDVHAIKTVLVYGETELRPLCGEAVRAGFEYQWCSRTVWFTYVDCDACRKALDRMALAEGRGQLTLFRHPRYV